MYAIFKKDKCEMFLLKQKLTCEIVRNFEVMSSIMGDWAVGKMMIDVGILSSVCLGRQIS